MNDHVGESLRWPVRDRDRDRDRGAGSRQNELVGRCIGARARNPCDAAVLNARRSRFRVVQARVAKGTSNGQTNSSPWNTGIRPAHIRAGEINDLKSSRVGQRDVKAASDDGFGRERGGLRSEHFVDRRVESDRRRHALRARTARGYDDCEGESRRGSYGKRTKEAHGSR